MRCLHLGASHNAINNPDERIYRLVMTAERLHGDDLFRIVDDLHAKDWRIDEGVERHQRQDRLGGARKTHPLM